MNFGSNRFALQQPRLGMPSGQPLLAPAMVPGAASGGYGGGFSDVRSQIAQAMMPRYGAAPRTVPLPFGGAQQPYGPRMGIQPMARGGFA